jgi:hypothetical protein
MTKKQIGNRRSAIGNSSAGYSGTPLPNKLGIKENFRIGLVNPPKSFVQQLGELPSKTKIVSSLKAPLDLIVVFVDRETTLSGRFPVLAEKLSPSGMIWVAWPKKSSGVKTDLTFDNVQRTGLDSGLVDVKICAIDDTWSGLKFVYRVKDRKRIEESRRA